MTKDLSSPNSSAVKVIALCLGGLAVLVILTVFFLPMLLSTSAGKEMLTKMLGKKSGFNVQIETLSLAWFGEQRAAGVQVQNTREQLSLVCQEITTDAPLWKILMEHDVGELKILAPQLQLAKPVHPTAPTAKPKRTPLAAGSGGMALPPNPSRNGAEQVGATGVRLAGSSDGNLGAPLAMPSIDLPFRGQIMVDQGKVNFNPPGLDPIVFDQIALSLDFRKKEELAIALNCQTQQREVQGRIVVKGSASLLNGSFPNLSLQSSVSQLPVLGIDQLIAVFEPGMDGVLYEALGATVDMQCDLSAARGNFDLKMDVRSPRISLQAATQTAGRMISLKAPATCSFSLTPALFAKIATSSETLCRLTLTQQGTLQAIVSRFSCPVPSSGKDLMKATFEASIAAPSQMPFSLYGKPLLIGNLKLDASSASLEENLSLTLSSAFQSGSQGGAIAVDGKISRPFSGDRQGMLGINASNLPMELISLAAGVDSPLADMLGPIATIQGSLAIEKDNPKAQISWRSQYLNIPRFEIALSNPYTLITPASFTYTFNPQKVTGDPVTGILNNLVIPADNLKNSRMDATLNTGKIVLAEPTPMTITALKAALSVKTLDQIGLDVNSDVFTASILGSWNMASSEFTLTKPLFMQYKLDDAAFQAIAPLGLHLTAPSRFKLTIDPLTLPLTGLRLDQLKCKGQISCAEVSLEALKKQIVLKNTSIPFQWDGMAKSVSVQMTSQLQNPAGEPGSIQGNGTLSNFSLDPGIDFHAATFLAELDLQNVSSALLDMLTQKASAGTLAGPTFGTQFKIQSSPDRQNLSLKWKSDLLNLNTSFLVDKTGLRLGSGTNQITWTMTPESYRFLDQLITGPKAGAKPGTSGAMILFEIKEATTFNLSLNKLSLPVTAQKEIRTFEDRIPNMMYDLHALELGATGSNSLLSFFDTASKESIRLQDLSFSMNKSAGKGPLTASLESTVVTRESSQSVKSGSFSLSGKLEETLDDKGVFDYSRLTAGLTLTVRQLPSRALDLIARTRGRTDFPFTTLFGNMINASANIDLKNFNGPVSLNVNTPITRIDLVGHVVNGALLLDQPFHTQMKISQEVSRLVLKEINPLNLSYIYSLAPVTLEIPSTGFYFPLYPFSMGKIAIPGASIELGKIFCRNEGNINITLGLLKSRQLEKNGELSLWFAPIDLKIKQGIVDIERTEILIADTFDICLFGQVDLVQDYVDMILGLTAPTLSKAFGIKNLPENYVLTIPLKGPADKVHINSGKATAKVALLLAWQNKNVAGALGGGTSGALFGELLGKVATLPDANAKIPPAKHPFPWEVGQKSKTSHTSSHDKKRNLRGDEKPLKQILKVIR